MDDTPHEPRLWRLSARRKLVLGCLSVVLLLAFSELLLTLAKPLYVTRLRNPFDADGHELVVRRNTALAETVGHNMLRNVLTHPERWILFRVRPNPGGQTVLGYTGINAQGFRSRAFRLDSAGEAGTDSGVVGRGDPGHGVAASRAGEIAAPTRARRVTCLGDSCTFGLGIYDHTKTFPHLLGEQLNAAGELWQVYNLGQPGYSTYQGLLLFRDWFARIRPDVLVLYFGWNDMWPSPQLTDRQTIAALTAPPKLPVPEIIRNSHIYTAMSYVVDTVRRSGQATDETATGATTRAPLEEGLQHYDEMLTKAEAAGTRTMFVIPPYSHPDLAALQNRFVAFYRKKLAGRVTFIELEKMQITNPSCNEYFQPDGLHPNEKGAAYIANELCKAMMAPHSQSLSVPAGITGQLPADPSLDPSPR